MTEPGRVRLFRVAKGLGALVLLAALLGGIPWALWHFVGWPLPHRLPSWSGLGHDLNERGIPDRVLVDALAVAVWLCWAVLVASVLAEVPAAIGGKTARRLPLAGAFQPLTGHLLAAVLVAVLSLAPRPTPAGAASLAGSRAVAAFVLSDATVPIATSAAPTGVRPNTSGVVDGARPTSPPAASSGAARTYVVRRGDTLWGIAERECGDPFAWSELYRLNAGRPQPGGRTLSDPHWIDPGWSLVLPPPAGAARSVPSPRPHAPVPAPATAPATSEPVPVQHHETTRRGAPLAPVQLPSGSVVGGSFVLGILSSLALARLRRRHAYRYHPPEPGRHLGPDPLRPTLRAFATAAQAPQDRDGELDEDEDDERGNVDRDGAGEQEPFVIVPAMADEDPDHRERPDLIEVGTRDGEPVALLLSELAGVALDGPDADDVVRAWVTALAVRAGPLAAELLGTERAIERLVPGAGDLARRRLIPGMRGVAEAEAVLKRLEAEVVSRTRQFEIDDAPDVLTYRRTYPWDPMPTMIAVIEQVPEVDATRWAAVFAAAARLGVGVIVLDAPSPGGPRLHLDADHLITDATPPEIAARLVGVRCFALQPGEAADVLGGIIETEERPASDDEDLAAIASLGPTREGDDDEPTSSGPGDGSAPEAWPGAPHADQPGAGQPGAGRSSVDRSRDDAALTARIATVPGATSPVAAPSVANAPIAVRVFGPYEIVVNGTIVDKGLRSVAKELLAWYVLRPEGASIGAAVEACWPDTDPAGVNDRYWRAASDLRTRVGAVAEPATKLLDQVGDVYRLDAAALDCDLWQFQAALATAARAGAFEVARDELRRATALYRGDFVENADYRWVAPVREDLHRRVLDAHLRLAELEAQLGALDAAEAALGGAIALDRFAEEPYRRLMTLQAGRGRLDAVIATWRGLERRLAEIDVDPEPATTRLYRSLSATGPIRGRSVHPLRRSS